MRILNRNEFLKPSLFVGVGPGIVRIIKDLRLKTRQSGPLQGIFGPKISLLRVKASEQARSMPLAQTDRGEGLGVPLYARLT